MNVRQKYFDMLPKYWQDYIAERGWFNLRQFTHKVRIDFEDGSSCAFNYAFMVTDEARREVAVFTEHCGYYVFPWRKCDKWEISDGSAGC